VPVIELTSEMEAITNTVPQMPDKDSVKGGHRIYELGGVSHGDSGVSGQLRPATAQLIERHHPLTEPTPACSVEDTDVPMRDVAQAALVNLDRWVSTGVAPPRASRLVVNADGRDYTRDAFGNPVGGCAWRNWMCRWSIMPNRPPRCAGARSAPQPEAFAGRSRADRADLSGRAGAISGAV
jgi:hypothetical protein